MRLGNTQLIIIGAVIAAFVVSTIAQNLVQKNALLLDRDLRDRIWRRETDTLYWWRFLETAGIIAMVAGMLRMLGIIPSSVSWGIPTMTIGFSIVCVAASLHAWLSNKAYSAVAPGTPASHSAFQAAIFVTLTEVSLGCVVCWFVFTHLPGWNTGKSTSNPPAPLPAMSPAPPPESKDVLWIDEIEALRLLKGKDAKYLHALAAREDVRSRDVDGKTEYRRDDISAMKLAGLPSMEELEASLAERKKNSPSAEKEK